MKSRNSVIYFIRKQLDTPYSLLLDKHIVKCCDCNNLIPLNLRTNDMGARFHTYFYDLLYVHHYRSGFSR